MAVCFQIRYELDYAHMCPVWLVKGNDIINHRKSCSSGEVKTSSKISDTVHSQLRDCCIKLYSTSEGLNSVAEIVTRCGMFRC